MAAYVLSSDTDLKPKSANGSTDWEKSLDREIEFYQWLQSSEGAIAGGASNSNNGRYEAWPAGTSTFYGMGYEANPVYHDPGSNTWFGFQTWSMQRMAEYYYTTKDPKVKNLLDKWAKWANSVIKFNADGTFEIPSKIDWEGQPDKWTGTYTGNPNLHVKIVEYGTDLGIAGSLANTLSYYAAATNDVTSKDNAKKILDCIWNKYQDSKGVSTPEKKGDYKRLWDEVYVPNGWTGTMPNGDIIQAGSTFISIRSKYKNDADWQKVETAVKEGQDPVMTYHRFWAECDVAIANGTYGILFGNDSINYGDVNDDGAKDSNDYALLKKYLLGEAVTINLKAADMNKDGSVDSIDLGLLKKLLLQ